MSEQAMRYRADDNAKPLSIPSLPPEAAIEASMVTEAEGVRMEWTVRATWPQGDEVSAERLIASMPAIMGAIRQGAEAYGWLDEEVEMAKSAADRQRRAIIAASSRHAAKIDTVKDELREALGVGA